MAESERALARPERDVIERRLARYRPEVQQRVRDVAARHAWIADLALSFPALLFALAAPRKGVDAHAVGRAVMDGAPLPRAALAAGVPMWMRSFPPEAFAAPLPQLPDGAEFRRRIANHLPAKWSLAPRWIESVAHAARWGGEEIALWFAREAPMQRPKRGRYNHKRPSDHHVLVCLWAWYSQHGRGHACDLLKTVWQPTMQWNAATDAARGWRRSIELRLYLGGTDLDDVWLREGEVDGYRFLALRSAEAIDAEAAAMKHCVRDYGPAVAQNKYRLWSVERDGAKVATLALGRGFRNSPFPCIVDFAGKRNAAAPVEACLAARQWLNSQDAEACAPGRFSYKAARLDAAMWRRFWRPFWLAQHAIPTWLPLAPGAAAFRDWWWG